MSPKDKNKKGKANPSKLSVSGDDSKKNIGAAIEINDERKPESQEKVIEIDKKKYMQRNCVIFRLSW
jgi:hypothetical protein